MHAADKSGRVTGADVSASIGAPPKKLTPRPCLSQGGAPGIHGPPSYRYWFGRTIETDYGRRRVDLVFFCDG